MSEESEGIEELRIQTVEKCVDEFLRNLSPEIKTKNFAIMYIGTLKLPSGQPDWLEDNIVATLLKKGIKIVERDENILKKIVMEFTQSGRFDVSMEDYVYKIKASRQAEILNADYVIAYKLIKHRQKTEKDFLVVSTKIGFKCVDTRTGLLTYYKTLEETAMKSTVEPKEQVEKKEEIEEPKSDTSVWIIAFILIGLAILMTRK